MEAERTEARVDLARLIDAVRAEIERSAGELDERFRKLVRYRPDRIPAEVIEPPAGGQGDAPENPGFTPQLVPGGDVGFTFDCLMKTFETWRNDLLDGKHPEMPVSVDGGAEWVFRAAYATKKRETPRKNKTGIMGPGYGLKMGDVNVTLGFGAEDGPQPGSLGYREQKTQDEVREARRRRPTAAHKKPQRRAPNAAETRGLLPGAAREAEYAPELDGRSPFLTIVLWAISDASSERHVFRFEPQQSETFGMIGRCLAHGVGLNEALELAQDAGGHDPRRKWRDGVRRAREMLYIVGSLGARRALRSPQALDAAVGQLDAAFRGEWKGDELTLLKSVSLNAEPTELGFARMTVGLLDEFLNSGSAVFRSAKADAERSLARLGREGDSGPHDVLHRSESVVADRSRRPDPECVRDGACPEHASPGQEDG